MLETVESIKLNYEVPILRNFRPNNLLHTCFQAMFVSTQQTMNALSDEVIDNNRDINASNIEQLLESVPSQISATPYKCHICKRSFSSDHGMSIHLHYCQKKNILNNIAEPPIGRDEVPDINRALNDRPMQGNLYEQQRDVHVWGEHTLKDLEQVINAVYEEVVKWGKNIFLLPSGAAGKSYVRETTRLIDAWKKIPKFLKMLHLKR